MDGGAQRVGSRTAYLDASIRGYLSARGPHEMASARAALPRPPPQMPRVLTLQHRRKGAVRCCSDWRAHHATSETPGMSSRTVSRPSPRKSRAALGGRLGVSGTHGASSLATPARHPPSILRGITCTRLAATLQPRERGETAQRRWRTSRVGQTEGTRQTLLAVTNRPTSSPSPPMSGHSELFLECQP